MNVRALVRCVGLVAMVWIWIAPVCAAADEPTLTFERTVIDLGPIFDDAEVTQPFKFTYTGHRMTALRFEQCSFCDKPDTDRAKYEPGQSGLVLMKLDPRGRHGEVTTQTQVAAEGGELVPLLLKASVRPRLMVRPDFLTLRDVPRQKGATATMTVISRAPDFVITGLTTESPWVEAVKKEPRPFEDLGDQCRAVPVTVRLKPGLPLGRFTAVVTASTSDPHRPTTACTIEADVVGDLVATPVAVSAGGLRTGDPFSMSFVIGTRSNRPLWYGSVKLAAKPARRMQPMALDVQPGDELGTLKVIVHGRAPDYGGTRIESEVIVTEEDAAGAVVDEVRVTVRLEVKPQRAVR